MEATTIKLMPDTKQELDSFREYRNESYDDILKKIVYIAKKAKTQPKLSKETIKRIEEARERMAKGEFVTHEELMKKYGLSDKVRQKS
jgi:predicted transcriptional regulator